MPTPAAATANLERIDLGDGQFVWVQTTDVRPAGARLAGDEGAPPTRRCRRSSAHPCRAGRGRQSLGTRRLSAAPPPAPRCPAHVRHRHDHDLVVLCRVQYPVREARQPAAPNRFIDNREGSR